MLYDALFVESGGNPKGEEQAPMGLDNNLWLYKNAEGSLFSLHCSLSLYKITYDTRSLIFTSITPIFFFFFFRYIFI